MVRKDDDECEEIICNDSPKKQIMHVATYNVNSLKGEERVVELEEDIKNFEWDIIGICEHRRAGKEINELKSGNLLIISGGDKAGKHGVGFLVNKKHKHRIEDIKFISERIIQMVIRINDQCQMRIIQVYAPTSRYTIDRVKAVYNKIKRLLTEKFEINIVMGDFNAKVGKAKNEDENSIGKYGYGERNKRGEMLVKFAQSNWLEIANTHFKKPDEEKWTWRHPKGNKSEIDYILIDKIKNVITDVNTINGIRVSNDHRFVRAKLKLNLKVDIPKVSEVFNMENIRINIGKFQRTLKAVLKNSFESKDDLTIDEYNSEMNKKIKEVAREIGGAEINFSREEIGENSKYLMETRKNQNLNVSFTEINHEIKASIREDLKQHKSIEMINIEDFEEIQIVKKHIVSIKDNNGNLLTSRQKITERILEILQEKYSSNANREVKKYKSVDSNIKKITVKEIKLAINQMKYDELPDTEGITMELLSNGGDIILHYLAILFTRCLEAGEIPSTWKQGKMILVNKKDRTQTDIKDYKSSNLILLTYKIFIEILSKRLIRILKSREREKVTPTHQISIIEHLHTVNQIIEKTAHFHMPLCLCFIHYKKEFDSTSNMLKALEEKIPEYLNIVMQMYTDRTSEIINEIGNKRGTIKIEKGLHGQDKIFPILFDLAIEKIFKQLNWEGKGLKVGDNYVNNLRFGNNMVLIANTPQELKDLMEELTKETLEAGLIINWDKTKIMYNNYVTVKQKITISGNKISIVSEHMYLGQYITKDANQQHEIEERIKEAKEIYKMCKDIFHNKKEAYDTKMTIFKKFILPKLTFASETWNLNQKQKDQLQNTEISMGMKMFKNTETTNVKIMLSVRKIRSKTRKLEKLNMEDVIQQITKSKRNWARKIANELDDNWARRVTYWNPTEVRRRGRPKRTWRDEVKGELKI